MIKHLRRNEIDELKYDACIEASINSRIYAYSWYLDCVADNWDTLVFNDYEAVMPLCWRTRYFIKYIYIPIWTQQLGIFSAQEFSKTITEKFIKSIPKEFRKIKIQFNSQNNLIGNEKSYAFNNYILNLNCSYIDLYAKFNSNRKRALKKSKKTFFEIDEQLTSIEYLKFYSSNSKFQSNKLKELKLKKLLALKQSKLIGIRYQDKLETILLYFIDNKRITYLLPVSSNKGKSMGLPTLLVSYLIEQNQNSNLIFDFEGSTAKGVASFYKSFGSSNETYTLFKCNFLHFF